MATSTGNTTVSRTNVVVTTSAGKVISSPDNYISLSLLGTDTEYTLPDATLNSGKIIIVDNDTGGSIKVDGYSSQTINDATDYDLADNNAITLRSNGSNWRIINSHII